MSRSPNTNQPEIISGTAVLQIGSPESGQTLFACFWDGDSTDSLTQVPVDSVATDPYIIAEVAVNDFTVQAKISRSDLGTAGVNVFSLSRRSGWKPSSNDKIFVTRRTTDGYPTGLIFQEGSSRVIEPREEAYPVVAEWAIFTSKDSFELTVSERQIAEGAEFWVQSEKTLIDDKPFDGEVKLYGTIQASDA